MPFADYKDFADCVAKNSDKSDPEAYCGTIKKQAEGLIHADFLKIYKQFHKVIKDEKEADDRYVTWVHALNLDETKPYANSMREQFQWLPRHTDLVFWKEDTRAKYWRFEAGFAVESMNENIYTEDELLRAARTLVGKPVNLNHKFPLPTIEIVAAEYENGVVEGVMRVPKTLMCPICDTSKTINDLIEQKGIFNNSLEAGCNYVGPESRVCEGMFFSGMALLTNATLPGIPLTRMLPLEHIMVEALQTADETKSKRRKRNVKRIEMQVVEEECADGEVWNPETNQCEPKKEQHTEDCGEDQVWDPRANDGHGGCVPTGEQSVEQVTTVDITDPTGPGQRNIAPKTIYPDEHGQCPEGMIVNQELGQCVLDENCPDNQYFDQKLQKCMPHQVPKPEHPETAVGTAAAPKELHDTATHDTEGGDDPHERPLPQVEIEPGKNRDVNVPEIPEPVPDKPLSSTPQPPLKPTTEPGKELGEPKDAHACPDGMHYDYDETQCVQDTPLLEALPTLEERIKRRKAERSAKALQIQLDESDRDYGVLYKTYQQLQGKLEAYKQTFSKLEKQIDRYNVEKVTDGVQIRDKNRRIEDLTLARDDYKHQLEQLKKLYDAQDRDYRKASTINLGLVKDLTESKAEYMELFNRTELLEAKLKHMRTLAKKTLKIKV